MMLTKFMFDLLSIKSVLYNVFLYYIFLIGVLYPVGLRSISMTVPTL